MKRIGFLIVLFTLSTGLFAQSPEAIHYQAVARDLNGNLLANQSIRFRISILQGSESGPSVYSEWHLKTTNSFGVATLVLGQGTVISGTFSTIEWGTDSHYVQTEMDPTGGTAYQSMGTSQLLSVPYALYSKISGSASYTAGTGLSLSGTTFNSVWTANDNNIFNNNPGNVGIGISNPTQQLEVTGSIELPLTIGSTTSGVIYKSTHPFLHDFQSPGTFGRNTFLGINAGNFTLQGSVDEASDNTGIGFQALQSLASGRNNTAVGSFSLNSNTDGIKNTALGTHSLSNNTSGNFNVGVGENTLSSNTTGSSNTAIGSYAMEYATGSQNTAIGYRALRNNAIGVQNTAVGYGSGTSDVTHNNTLSLGYNALSTSDNQVRLGNSDITSLFCQGSYAATSILPPNMVTDATGQIMRSTASVPTGSGAASRIAFWNAANSLGSSENFFWDNANTWLGVGTTQPTQQLTITQSFALPSSTPASLEGIIYKGSKRFIHTYYPAGAYGMNTFVGINSGNLDLSYSSWDDASYNTSLGFAALSSLTSGYGNTALGQGVLAEMTNGFSNVGIGNSALASCISGNQNIAIGSYSLIENTASNNVAIGISSLGDNTTGSQNVCIGNSSGRANVNGSGNILIGYKSGEGMISGTNNIVIGYDVDPPSITSSYQLVIGASDLLSGNISTKMIGIGAAIPTQKLTVGNGNIALTNTGMAGEIMLYEPNGSGTNYSSLKAQAQTGNVTYTLPAADGSNGQVLSTNGSGTLNWTANNAITGNGAATRIAFWDGTSTLNSNASLTWDNVNSRLGIGTITPTKAIETTADININSVIIGRGGGNLNSNTLVGRNSFPANTTGNNNVAVGYESLLHNTTGNYNTGIGSGALYNNVGTHGNVAIGYNAGLSGSHTNAVFLGYNTYLTTNRSNVILLGSGITNSQCTGDNQVLLGNTSITQIRAQVGSITTYSDARFKTHIREDVQGLDFIMKLRPVTFNEQPSALHRIWGTPDSILNQMDHSQIENTRFIGFLAQDVEAAARECGFDFPGIDVPTSSAEVYTLRYTDFMMPLVKAIQEQQVMIEELRKENNELRIRLDKMESGR